MKACESPEETLCGCCTGTTQETPERIFNRPALPAIAYRAGRYATFNASMQASLTSSDRLPLALLRTRDPADFTLALIDSWSVVLDILTFYQERFANEAFLRTAVDRRSVFELARLIGYVPSPGVAASTVLAFTLSDATGSPDNVRITAGTRVQSVPGPGQMPQVFETATDITARIGYNALPARTSQPWKLADGGSYTWIQGTANNINVGDALLFVTASDGQPAEKGPGNVRYVTQVVLDAKAGTTMIRWDVALPVGFNADTSAQMCMYVFRKKAALYGAQAPNPMTLPNKGGGIPGAPSGNATDWNYDQYVTGSGHVNLDQSIAGLGPSGTSQQWIVLTGLGYTSFFRITAAAESNPNLYTLTAKTTQLTLAPGQILTGNTHLGLDDVLKDFTKETRDITAYVQSTQLQPAGLPLTQWDGSSNFTLQDGMLAPVGGGSIDVMGGQQVAVGQPIGVSGKRVRLQVKPSANATFIPAHSSNALKVADNQIFLVNAFPPGKDSASGSPAWSVDSLSGITGTLLLKDSSVLLLPSDKGDDTVSEASAVSTTAVNGDVTTLGLGGTLSRLYDAATVKVNANAVQATHGETMQEILGSGDASNDSLQFTLKQSPLTYVSATTGNGTQSTLQVWVNNLQWHEAPNLLSSGPADRAFVSRANASGQTIVQFGNGIDGARPPTGQMNIRAIYRKGIGSAGMVAAGQLSQPLDRPQGLTAVTNPSAASGGADPASADDARIRAPLPTLTLDRVVSLEDYQNFALNFGGIAKAVATWVRFGGTRGVFLTVAGADGATFAPTDPVVTHLIDALRAHGNPFIPLQVASYVPVLFELSASIAIDQDNYDATQVLAAVWQNLSNAFAFAQRQIGQSVAAAEVIEIIQQTPGVVAVRLQVLAPSGSSATSVPTQLCAASAMPPLGAQMLLLDPASRNSIGVWS
ncbi:putative baseplate assembly protein [Dyella subtropica]|uniref:putative baseplate assembly protein n=1 Tax=Dyella subtropica TaxID=2992127 RepID=UPI00224F72AD|nr:putative baseplate assembly protein [Dyella subtropica]